MTTNQISGNDPQDEDEYDYYNDRVCSYPCHICGEVDDDEDEWEDDES